MSKSTKVFEVTRNGDRVGVTRKTKNAALTYVKSLVDSYPEYIWGIVDQEGNQIYKMEKKKMLLKPENRGTKMVSRIDYHEPIDLVKLIQEQGGKAYQLSGQVVTNQSADWVSRLIALADAQMIFCPHCGKTKEQRSTCPSVFHRE